MQSKFFIYKELQKPIIPCYFLLIFWLLFFKIAKNKYSNDFKSSIINTHTLISYSMVQNTAILKVQNINPFTFQTVGK